MARKRIDTELLETKVTVNPGVTYNLERFDDEYTIYILSYEERVDMIMYDKDLAFMKNLLNFFVDSYNDGFTDGKNSALMFFK